MRSIVLLAALLAIGCEGAVLVRFINTVPSRTSPTFPTIVGGSGAGGRVQAEGYADRIGLQYSSTGQAPALVWTEATNARSAEVSAGLSPYAYTHSMPPLRQYHKTNTVAANPNVVLIDTVANYKVTDMPSDRCTIAASCDNYEQSYLKADGVGLYLQFAAGTYTLQAYAIVTSGNQGADISSAARPITSSSRSVTFDDNKVYTIVAVGSGAFAATPALTGNTVALSLIEESVAPTTFGFAAIRWFHAIKAQSASPISIFQTSTTGTALASDIPFGAVSNYVDVLPNSAATFPVTATSSTSTVITGSTLASTHDIRAGLRATIICAQNDETIATVFCRLIPSRVVAYVRLVNDLASQTNQVQGPFGGQALNTVKLTLWGSYELPRPSQVVEGAQNVGVSAVPRIATLARGLFGVVSGVAAGTVSGYGETFVPVLIMDYAVRFIIARDSTEIEQFVKPTGVAPANIDYTINPNTVSPIGVANFGWFIGAPVAKRTNFVVKTDGFSTLSGLAAGSNSNRDDANKWLNQAVLLDTYMEPGQFYTLIVTATPPALNTLPYVASTIQTTGVGAVRFYWRLDRTIDGVSSSSSLTGNGKANINFIPIGTQNLNSAISLRKTGSSGVALSTTPTDVIATPRAYTIAVTGGAAVTDTTTTLAWNEPTVAISADAGDYSFDQTGNGEVCTTKIPNSNAVTLAAGDIIDVFLMNTFGCVIQNSNPNALVVLSVKTQSALVTGHAVNTLLDGTAPESPSGGGFFASSASATSSSVALLAALLALVAALL